MEYENTCSGRVSADVGTSPGSAGIPANKDIGGAYAMYLKLLTADLNATMKKLARVSGKSVVPNMQR